MVERILIVGSGSIGQRHLRLARETCCDADIRVLRHHSSEPLSDAANGSFSTLEQALAFAPQIAVVANPATLHLPVAQVLAEAGAHLLVEKPISASAMHVPQLIETCRRLERVLIVGYNLRFLPSLREFRRLIAENVVGQIVSVRCEVGQYLPSWRPGMDYRSSVSARRELGGGALLELSHEVDYLRWIFGEVDAVLASLTRQSCLEVNVEDTAHLILRFASDRDTQAVVASANLDYVRHDTTRLCTAIGERGSLRWNGLTGVVERFSVGAAAWSEVFRQEPSRDESFLAEWEHFLACVNQEQAPLVRGEDGLAVIRIVDAVRRSAETGSQVRLGGPVAHRWENR